MALDPLDHDRQILISTTSARAAASCESVSGLNTIRWVSEAQPRVKPLVPTPGA